MNGSWSLSKAMTVFTPVGLQYINSFLSAVQRLKGQSFDIGLYIYIYKGNTSVHYNGVFTYH